MVADPYVGSRLMIFAVCLQEIIPFIDKQWENLTTQTRRTKQTWHATVAKTLVHTQFHSDTLQSQKCYLENLFNIDVPIIFFHHMHIFLIICV